MDKNSKFSRTGEPRNNSNKAERKVQNLIEAAKKCQTNKERAWLFEGYDMILKEINWLFKDQGLLECPDIDAAILCMADEILPLLSSDIVRKGPHAAGVRNRTRKLTYWRRIDVIRSIDRRWKNRPLCHQPEFVRRDEEGYLVECSIPRKSFIDPLQGLDAYQINPWDHHASSETRDLVGRLPDELRNSDEKNGEIYAQIFDLRINQGINDAKTLSKKMGLSILQIHYFTFMMKMAARKIAAKYDPSLPEVNKAHDRTKTRWGVKKASKAEKEELYKDHNEANNPPRLLLHKTRRNGQLVNITAETKRRLAERAT